MRGSQTTGDNKGGDDHAGNRDDPSTYSADVSGHRDQFEHRWRRVPRLFCISSVRTVPAKEMLYGQDEPGDHVFEGMEES